MQREYNLTRNYNLLFSAVCCLILIGFIFIYSSSSVYALEYAHDAEYFCEKVIVRTGVQNFGSFYSRA